MRQGAAEFQVRAE